VKTWVIGDVHGCSVELAQLLRMASGLTQNEPHRFIFLGDLVHKGPDPKGVIAQVRGVLHDRPGSVCLAGNHEEIEIRASMKDPKKTPEEPVRQKLDNLSADEIEFLKSLPLLHQFEVDGSKYIAVHGGIPPSFPKAYPEGIGEIPADWHKGGGKKMDRLRRFLRARYVNPAGDMVAMGQEKPEDKFWAEVYQGEYGVALFGHDPSETGAIRFFPNAIGLDTGCVFGRSLTAYCLEDGLILQVQAERQYAEFLNRNAE